MKYRVAVDAETTDRRDVPTALTSWRTDGMHGRSVRSLAEASTRRETGTKGGGERDGNETGRTGTTGKKWNGQNDRTVAAA